MCGSLLPPARNTPSTGKPANVLQQVSNLASLASVARGGYVLPTTLRSLFFFHVSSMSPCTATIKVSGFLGGASGPRENFIKTFAGAETHPCLVGERSPDIGPFGEPELNRVMQSFRSVGGHRQC